MSVAVEQQADPAAALKAAAAQSARDYVHSIATSKLPAELRVSAWNALRSSRGDEAIAEWMAPGGGYAYTKQRLKDSRSQNRSFCERVVATHTAEFSPAVRAAAQKALKGSDADRAAFVKSGYAEAQKRDRATREADVQHKLEVAAGDREFVGTLAEHAPGEQVRVAARWALRAGATDADIAEFYHYGWATGGSLDLEAFRLYVSDAETARRAGLTQLIAKAAAAEEAVRGAADAAKARAEAEAAWKAVSEHAGSAQQAWQAEQEAAAAQAENWRNIAKAAKESANGLWQGITDPAQANGTSWAEEQAGAAVSAGFWKDMFERAREAENRVKG
ncbi:ALF repeat-containing protein [Streptomyces sp. CBMA152]|uniref:ALF repeat-containing protein n=1 Tax=Streptomyces sp. CBMA152 TaxID=1896312 RepID=UPI002948BEE1|nr:ALF repeat-containing protein [Streptomyces sp. CBMA152]